MDSLFQAVVIAMSTMTLTGAEAIVISLIKHVHKNVRINCSCKSYCELSVIYFVTDFASLFLRYLVSHAAMYFVIHLV